MGHWDEMWDTLDWFESASARHGQSEKHRRLFAELHRVHRAWHDDTSDHDEDDAEDPTMTTRAWLGDDDDAEKIKARERERTFLATENRALRKEIKRLQRAYELASDHERAEDGKACEREKENLRAKDHALQPAHDNADERAPPPHAEASNKRKRDADAACASLGDDSLCRARIPELSRPRLRLYLKSMGASTHGNPQELKDRLLQLFVLNDIEPDEPQVRFDALKWYHPNDTYVSVWDENAKKWDEVQVRRTVVRITKVPASARDIAAPAVPSNSRFVEGELAALHTAWEAEVKSKLAPAN